MDEASHLTAYLISLLTLSLPWHSDLMAFHLKGNTKLHLQKRLEVVKILWEKKRTWVKFTCIDEKTRLI